MHLPRDLHKRWENHPLRYRQTSLTEHAIQELGLPGMARSVAVHEAGHTAVALALGGTVDAVSVDAPDAGVTTRTMGEKILMIHLAVVTAGEVAQEKWLREIGAGRKIREWATTEQALQDKHWAEGFIREHRVPRREVTDGTKLADQMVSRHWRNILRLSKKLDDHRVLRGHGRIRSAAGM